MMVAIIGKFVELMLPKNLRGLKTDIIVSKLEYLHETIGTEKY